MKSRRDNEPHTGHETIPVIEERPVLLTKPVRTSTVRIDKIVREHEASIEAVLRSDEVVVERRSVDPPQPVDAPPPVRHEGDVTIIPILEERLVVEKRLFVREELRVRRVERSRVSRQRVTVRSEDVRVEREPMSQRAAEGSSTQSKEKAMDRMLVAVFDSKDEAEAARGALRDLGINEDRITIRTGTDEDRKWAGSTTDEQQDHTGFFGRLFERVTDNRSHGHAYTEAMRRGGCVVVVDGVGDDRVDEAARVLEQNGAFDIDERASKWRAEGWQAPEMNAPTTSAQSRPQMQAETRPRTRQASGQMQAQAAGTGMQSVAGGAEREGSRIPVVEEQLQVGKREVQRGGVRVYTRTSERPVEEDVTLREERVRVERHPADRPASESDLANAFKEQSIELRETAEEPVIAKTARVVEEVEVGKEVQQRTQKVQDTVRRTDVEVEGLSENQRDASSRSARMARTQASAGTSARGAQGASTDLDDLNRLLRDELSAVETYRQALDKNRDAFENDARFRELSQMHDDHQQAAAELRQLIQQMGGSPVDDSGAWGTWANTVMGTARLFGDKAALKALKEGEESGIKDYQQAMQERGAARELQSVLTSAMSKTQQHIRLLDRMIDAV